MGMFCKCRSIKCCTREEEDRKAWENRDGCIKGGYIKRNGLSGEEVSSPQHKHWPTGPAHFSDRRASTLYLSLALQDHRVKCRASRLKITVADD